ncbi:basic phospholipase A2-like isoform X2 [Pleurodeles waltl]
MMLDVTGKTSFPYYTSYGCHCGKGGAGMPVDATDWCCWTHDCCYEKLGLEGCSPKTEYYRYQVYKGIVVCGGYPKSCKRNICECDKAAALCFKENMKTYRNYNMFKLDMTCKGETPPCKYDSDASANSAVSSKYSASERSTKEAQAPVQTENIDASKQV